MLDFYDALVHIIMGSGSYWMLGKILNDCICYCLLKENQYVRNEVRFYFPYQQSKYTRLFLATSAGVGGCVGYYLHKTIKK